MARIKYVAKAQQRYETVPVLDPDTGEQKVITVNKVTKRGRQVTRSLTVSDKSKPLPPYDCGFCHKPIEVGTPYKHVSIKSGPYGGHTLRRHQGCPSWKQSELTTSKMAGIYAAQESWQEFIDTDFDNEDDVRSALEDVASQIREVAEEYRESAENIRDGFGHDTFMSEELDAKADDLEAWADEVESSDVPELSEQTTCEDCDGSGEVDCTHCFGTGSRDCENCTGTGVTDEESKVDCTECDGSGEIDCADCGTTGQEECENCTGTGEIEPTEESLEEWRQEVRDSLVLIDECPV